jgi:hypothetical protein
MFSSIMMMEDLKMTKIGSNMLSMQYLLLKIHPIRVVLTVLNYIFVN